MSVFMSMIHYGNGKVIWIRTESGNVSRSISSGIMEMKNLYGLGQKLEMCPNPSHLEISKFNKMQICGTYKSGWHGNFFLQAMSE